jgi:hypothetical protein
MSDKTLREEAELTKDRVISLIIAALPYSSHLKHFDTSENGAVRFQWRSDRFRVSVPGLLVEETDGHLLKGSNLAILVEHLIKQRMVYESIYEGKEP